MSRQSYHLRQCLPQLVEFEPMVQQFLSFGSRIIPLTFYPVTRLNIEGQRYPVNLRRRLELVLINMRATEAPPWPPYLTSLALLRSRWQGRWRREVVLDPPDCLTEQGEAGRDCMDLSAPRELSEVVGLLYIMCYHNDADNYDNCLYIPSSRSLRSTNVY